MERYRVYEYIKSSGKRKGYETFSSLEDAKNSAKRLKTLYGLRTKIVKLERKLGNEHEKKLKKEFYAYLKKNKIPKN